MVSVKTGANRARFYVMIPKSAALATFESVANRIFAGLNTIFIARDTKIIKKIKNKKCRFSAVF